MRLTLKKVEDLGERKIIELILRHLEPLPDMPVPFGDDVAAVDIGEGKLAVIKTDMLVGKTDVPPKMTLWQAARKAVVMNISDLAAKGVRTTALLAAIGVPRGFNEKDIEQIAKGLNAGAREYDAYVLGGDTSEASDLVISCSAYGTGDKDHLMLRTGAREGDFLAVTGSFGKTSAGLRILLGGLPASSKLHKELVKSVLMPRARLKEGLSLARTFAVTSAIDSSDGLAVSLNQLSLGSNVGFMIDKLPIAEEAMDFAQLHGLDAADLCLYGGEEYELVVTVKPRLWKKATKEAPLVRIGRATEERTIIFKLGKKTYQIENRGWEHFKTSRRKS
jgi:thiamine-monophosphate kinase